MRLLNFTMLKTHEQRLRDLKDHASLLDEACVRFREQHKLYEIRNIATRLRILLDNRRGNDLLFDLAQGKALKVLVLDKYMEMTITEIETGSGKILQKVTKRKLQTKPIPDQPTLPIITTRYDFLPWLKETDLKEWLSNGFLMDWEVPNNEGTTPKITRLTPIKLINSFADKEASHSDKEFSKDFGAPFEKEIEEYIFNSKPITIPVIYNYLYQIGQVAAQLSHNLLKVL